MQALRSDDIAFLRWLIPTYQYNIQDHDSSGQTLLMYALNHSLATTQFVVNELKLDVNARDAAGVTPLMLATKNLDFAKIKFLVAKGGRVNVQDKEGLTPIMYLAQAAQFNDSGPPNDAACQDAIKYLMAHGGRIGIKDKSGLSAVDYVKDKPFPELIALLK
jgi:ankyrin repeat protein